MNSVVALGHRLADSSSLYAASDNCMREHAVMSTETPRLAKPRPRSVDFSGHIDAANRRLQNLGDDVEDGLASILLEYVRLSVEMLKLQDEALRTLQEELDRSRKEVDAARRRYPEGSTPTPFDGLITDLNESVEAAP